ncbi:T9SS type A sorting domain-containing protein [Nonlabens xiamenensis]|uniref:T9SS type A sorting domain-containing protein n=1 Tax=Nonlabens xiamenensis TaxID=2341043 RepID=UPI000F60C42E|nr:T9SS type A sorting domain-containing protein [Nonlabens xiamenensis]
MKTKLLFLLFGFFMLSSGVFAMQDQPDIVQNQWLTDKEEMSLLTNPVKDGYLKLRFSSTTSTSLNVTIINSLGKQVYNAKRGMSDEVHAFDVSKLPAGIYFLRVNTDDSNFVKKLIIK